MSTASDGNIYTITQTMTSAPTTSSSSGGSASSASQTSNLGAIVGGAIGGFIGLTVIVLAIWWLMRRRSNWDDIFEKDVVASHAVFPVTRRDPPPDPKPKPYEYGLVGHMPPPTSPPSSTGLSLSSEGPGHHPQLSDPFSQQHNMGHQDPFLQQQQVGPNHQGPFPQQQQVGPGHQGPLSQQQQVGPGHQGSYPQQQVGPGHQGPLSQQQQVGPGHQGSYPQQQVGPGHQGSYPQQQVGPSHQDPFPQQQQIGGAPQDARLMPGGSGVPVIPLAAPNNPNAWVAPASGRYPPGVQNSLSARQAQGRPSTAGEESGVFGVIDAGPLARPSTAASMSSHGRSQPSVTASSVVSHGPAQPGPSTYEFDPYLEQEQEQQPSRERRDGKGRLITTGEKRPIVHLDGGRYRAPGASTSTAFPNPDQPGAFPPAYSA
ncbi:hypothetical protein M378DRAFT_859729 [Amanita muscaria Koide BX008]|uniref:Uncharacterized protein n=1 Tax=Amanita muscaria (strain Koide BX008) TaxID=946122 RepID=A0A0C2WWS7_AMAMK|nr:hypothetical protein M378DRAFT_859729 [Amanita muscaria Koide BX008]